MFRSRGRYWAFVALVVFLALVAVTFLGLAYLNGFKLRHAEATPEPRLLGVATVNRLGDVVAWDAPATGLSERRMLGRNLFLMVPPRQRDKALTNWRNGAERQCLDLAIADGVTVRATIKGGDMTALLEAR